MTQRTVNMTTSDLTDMNKGGDTQVESTSFRGLETRSVHAWFGKHHALAGVSLRET